MNFEELERNLATLQKIAERFPISSIESKAIERAAEAMLFVCQKEMREAFAEFLLDRDQPLSPEQILHLRALGLDPDAVDKGG